MKKLLLAALLTAGIATAQAQSSVSIYGILDVGYIGSSAEGAVVTEVSCGLTVKPVAAFPSVELVARAV